MGTRSQTVNPRRITLALDLRDLYGPEVDRALGGEEPMVDEWEAGIRTPTDEQLWQLALLTSFPVPFFYLPDPELTGVWVCDRRKRKGGCQYIQPEASPAQGELWR